MSRGKEWRSVREITMPSSVAAACNSKSKLTQNRLRRASPQARLMRLPKGVCSTSCMPPDSSKKRSATTRSTDGTHPRAARVSPTYAATWSAPARPTPVSSRSQRRASSPSAARRATFSRTADTARESSRLRPGDSPNQNGSVGGAPWASSTHTLPEATRRIRHEVLPSRKMSPARLSTAKSSLTLPTKVSVGDSTTS